jgi:hypothetical protein
VTVGFPQPVAELTIIQQGPDPVLGLYWTWNFANGMLLYVFFLIAILSYYTVLGDQKKVTAALVPQLDGLIRDFHNDIWTSFCRKFPLNINIDFIVSEGECAGDRLVGTLTTDTPNLYLAAVWSGPTLHFVLGNEVAAGQYNFVTKVKDAGVYSLRVMLMYENRSLAMPPVSPHSNHLHPLCRPLELPGGGRDLATATMPLPIQGSKGTTSHQVLPPCGIFGARDTATVRADNGRQARKTPLTLNGCHTPVWRVFSMRMLRNAASRGKKGQCFFRRLAYATHCGRNW